MSIHESMGPDEIYPKILRELRDVVPKPLSMVLENQWQSGELPGDWIKENVVVILEREKKRIL